MLDLVHLVEWMGGKKCHEPVTSYEYIFQNKTK